MAVAITVDKSWTEGDVTGKRHTALQCTVVVTSAAATTIAASVFGFVEFVDSSPAVKSDDSAIHFLVPNTAKTSLKGFSAAATAAGLPIGTWDVLVRGVNAKTN